MKFTYCIYLPLFAPNFNTCKPLELHGYSKHYFNIGSECAMRVTMMRDFHLGK